MSKIITLFVWKFSGFMLPYLLQLTKSSLIIWNIFELLLTLHTFLVSVIYLFVFSGLYLKLDHFFIITEIL